MGLGLFSSRVFNGGRQVQPVVGRRVGFGRIVIVISLDVVDQGLALAGDSTGLGPFVGAAAGEAERSVKKEYKAFRQGQVACACTRNTSFYRRAMYVQKQMGMQEVSRQAGMT